MDIAHAVEMLLLDPEGAAHAAIVLHPVPERPAMSLVIVAAPGSPTGEFAFGADVQVGSVKECGFGQLVHGIWTSFVQSSS